MYPTTPSKFYITTSIAYPTATPHVGYAMELVQADVLARFYRASNTNTYYITGTDEHGQKLFAAAEKAGENPIDFVAKTSDGFEALTKKLNLSNDGFVRTTSPGHKASAQKLWQACIDDIYRGDYSGLYCVDCERYYTEKESVEDGLCPIHKIKLQEIKIESYFLRLEKYRDQLVDIIESDGYRIFPQLRKNEVLSFLKNNQLEDLSISRPKTQLQWGVEVPGDDTHVMYVWFDALTNYLTGAGYISDPDKFSKLWPPDMHVIGKDISRFHAVYWPIMLLSAELPLPKSLYVHGFINTPTGEKLSKSLGNAGDPSVIIDNYGVDALRYFVLRYIPHDGDGEFSMDRFAAVYESDLANDLGNLVQRVATMVVKYCDGKVGKTSVENISIEAMLADCKFDTALNTIFDRVVLQNQRIEETKPWLLVKTDEVAVHEFLASVTSELLEIARALEPFLPETATKIHHTFAEGKIHTGVGILFPRIEDIEVGE